MGTTAPRKISILGSTGSVGRSTLKVLAHTEEPFTVDTLVAARNVHALAAQAKEMQARSAVIADESLYAELQSLLAGTSIQAAAGKEAVIEAASQKNQLVMAAITGIAGLAPVMGAIRAGNNVALANKECLVCAGQLMLDEAAAHGAALIPVDSEHNALFQVFDFAQSSAVEKITLTASGGPFRHYSREAMDSVTVEQALNHPNWSMGAKISIDSATMMNKGLELIEAYYLFPVEAEQIEVVVHPESIIHGLVSYKDGSVLAQLGSPDMCTPIASALAWPKRMHAPSPRLDLTRIGQLTFYSPDTTLFPALSLARKALDHQHSVPVVLNAANEVAVHGFLEQMIGFLEIMRIVEDTLSAVPFSKVSSIEDVFAVDEQARNYARERLGHYRKRFVA